MAESAVVEVRDGSQPRRCRRRGQSNLLVNLGFPEGSVVESEPPADDALAETEIIDFTGKTYSAGKIAEWLGVPPIAVRAATPADADLRTTGADIVVVLGDDADVTGLSSDSTGSGSSQ